VILDRKFVSYILHHMSAYLANRHSATVIEGARMGLQLVDSPLMLNHATGEGPESQYPKSRTLPGLLAGKQHR
jgi:hypothetical protein